MDRRTAIIRAPQGDAIRVADVAAQAVIRKLDGPGAPRGASIAADGKTAFVTLAADPAVGVVDVVARTLVREVGGGRLA